jgi:methionine-rich copper-binding protein CopC
MKSPLAAFAAFALATAALGGVALAHAQYKSSDPKPGQTLQASPAAVNVTFSEDLAQGSTGAVTNANGATVSSGATIDANERTKLSIALNPSLPNGVYKVAWHSISADDGDSLDGTFFFGVGVAAPSTFTAPAPSPLSLALIAGGLLLAVVSSALLRRRGWAA